MLNSFSFADTYDCEKLRILQSMNDQIEVMAVKLDQIVTHIEEVVMKKFSIYLFLTFIFFNYRTTSKFSRPVVNYQRIITIR